MRKISPQEQRSDQRFNVSIYWRVFWRRKHFVIIPVLIAAVVSVIGMRFLAPMYESSTVIRVEDRNLLSQDVARFVQIQDRRRVHDSETLSRMRAEILSTPFIDRLIRNLGLDTNEDIRRKVMRNQSRRSMNIPIEELINRELRKYLGSKISFGVVGPGMFRVSFFDYSPEACYVIAGAVANLFVEMQQIQRIKAFQEANEFSDEQLAVYKEQLENSELELTRLEKNLSERKLGKIPITERNIKFTETLERRFEINVADREDIIERIRENLNSLFGAVPSGEAISTDAELLNLESSLIAHRETELLLELGEGGRASVELAENQDIISEIHTNIQRRLATLVIKSYPNVNTDYRALIVEYFFQLSYLKGYRGKLDKLRYYIDVFRENLEIIPQLERRINQLRETVETNRSLYNTFLGAKTSAQISEAVQSTNLGATVEVVEQPIKPLYPVKPNKIKISFIALLFSGIVGIGGLLLVELSDTSFETVEDVEEKLGVRVLGTIPRFDSDQKWRRKNTKKKVALWITGSLVVIVISLLGFYYRGKSAQTHFYTENTTEETLSRGINSGD